MFYQLIHGPNQLARFSVMIKFPDHLEIFVHPYFVTGLPNDVYTLFVSVSARIMDLSLPANE